MLCKQPRLLAVKQQEKPVVPGERTATPGADGRGDVGITNATFSWSEPAASEMAAAEGGGKSGQLLAALKEGSAARAREAAVVPVLHDVTMKVGPHEKAGCSLVLNHCLFSFKTLPFIAMRRCGNERRRTVSWWRSSGRSAPASQACSWQHSGNCAKVREQQQLRLSLCPFAAFPQC